MIDPALSTPTPPSADVQEANLDAMTEAVSADVAEPNRYQRRILFALPRTGKHVYAGTVPAATVARRRAARKARRATRQSQRRAAA